MKNSFETNRFGSVLAVLIVLCIVASAGTGGSRKIRTGIEGSMPGFLGRSAVAGQ